MHVLEAPSSKSYTNRALVMAALTHGSVHLKRPLYCDDTQAMIHCLQTLGIRIETLPDQIIVHGHISEVQPSLHHLFAKDSGTTARFLLPLLCLVPGVKILEGNPQLAARPMKDLVNALRSIGAIIDSEHLPIKISSSTLSSSTVSLNADVSSQFCSALLLITPIFPLTIHLTTAPISSPYIAMTRQIIHDFSAGISEYTIEGDFSSASYFFAFAALHQCYLTVRNLNPHSLQADRQFLDILASMGNQIYYGKDEISIEGKGVLPVNVNMQECPDQVMTLAVLAAFAKGTTHITGVRSLRVKETERVVALKQELGRMGIATEDTHDTLTIYGGAPRSATIHTYNDHRIAMSFAITKMPICNPEVVNKTFPTFWQCLEKLK